MPTARSASHHRHRLNMQLIDELEPGPAPAELCDIRSANPWRFSAPLAGCAIASAADRRRRLEHFAALPISPSLPVCWSRRHGRCRAAYSDRCAADRPQPRRRNSNPVGLHPLRDGRTGPRPRHRLDVGGSCRRRRAPWIARSSTPRCRLSFRASPGVPAAPMRI